MTGATPQERARSARSRIAALTYDIKHHDSTASDLRKDREKAKAKLARAERAIARESAARFYNASKGCAA